MITEGRSKSQAGAAPHRGFAVGVGGRPGSVVGRSEAGPAELGISRHPMFWGELAMGVERRQLGSRVCARGSLRLGRGVVMLLRGAFLSGDVGEEFVGM